MDKKIILKEKFMKLDPSHVLIQAVSFDKKVIGHTTYQVEIGFTNEDGMKHYYAKQLRFRDLEALDTILSQKFKNLKFSALPSKDIFQMSKEETRLKYIQDLLAEILNYSINDKNLQKTLFNFLYNFLLKEDAHRIKMMTIVNLQPKP